MYKQISKMQTKTPYNCALKDGLTETYSLVNPILTLTLAFICDTYKTLRESYSGLFTLSTDDFRLISFRIHNPVCIFI